MTILRTSIPQDPEELSVPDLIKAIQAEVNEAGFRVSQVKIESAQWDKLVASGDVEALRAAFPGINLDGHIGLASNGLILTR